MCSTLHRLVTVVTVSIFITACSGGSSSSSSSDDAPVIQGPTMSVVTGSVGDGPVVGADLVVADATGSVVLETTSDLTARYRVEIPDDTPMPVRVRATGGTDLVTGRPADFAMEAVVLGTGTQTVNISPLTTLAVLGAECAGTVSRTSLDQMWSAIDDQMSMGLAATIDPMTDPVSVANAAEIVLASEALGEVVRRTDASLSSAGATPGTDAILRQVACDLVADGLLDGNGTGVDARTIATFRAAEGAVLLETLAGRLEVGAADATELMNTALATILGEDGIEIDQVAPTFELVDQTAQALALFLGDFDDESLGSMAAVLDDDDPMMVATAVDQELDAQNQTEIAGLAERVALSTDTTIEQLAVRLDTQDRASAPIVSFSADGTQVAPGERVTLSWASTDADRCMARGERPSASRAGWSGRLDREGFLTTEPLQADTNFNIVCTGLGGTTSNVVSVVVSDTAPAPTVTLTVSDATVEAGDSVELEWSSENANNCTASGDWAGDRATSGMETMGPLDASESYTLMCSGDGGTATASVAVAVSEPAPAPTVELSSSASSIDEGGTAMLNWSSSNATGCNADGAWSGSKAMAGSERTAALTTTSTFSLTCVGAGGSATDSVTVTVIPTPPPDVSLSAAATTVDYDGSTTLDWSAVNATSCSASGGWSGSRSVEGNEGTGALQSTTTFTLTCSGPGGSATRSVTIAVNEPDGPTVSLSAAASQVASGESTTLTWTSANADSCSADGGWSGPRATEGNQSTGVLTSDTQFTLTCTGVGGSATDSVTVAVTTPDAPTVTLSAASTELSDGDATTLSWSSTGADSCTASGDWSGPRETSGNTSTGALTADASYTLSCTGPGGTDQATVSINVTALEPTVALTAEESVVSAGDATTLTWTSQNATGCEASGDWTGPRETSGSESTGALQTSESYTLTFTGAGGSALSITTVEVLTDVTLAWDAPTTNVDGSDLTDLAGYRLYIGDVSGSYGSEPIELPGSAETTYTTPLEPGVYYMAVTAYDEDGTESDFSNEIVVTVD